MALEGKTALVTGASRGIGKAIALSLAEAGADVIVNYAGSREAAEAVAEQIRGMGRRAETFQANVADAAQADAMIKFAFETFGKLDILVNNAGITRDNLLIRMKEDEWDEVIAVNLKGVYNCLKAAARPMMKQRSGTIINISSVVGVIGNVGQVNYSAAKAGVIGMTKSAARELAPRGITVNCVAPGYIDTEMTEKLDDGVKEAMLAHIPLARMGKPEEVADVVRFLASGAAAYMTGQTLHVDGGMYM